MVSGHFATAITCIDGRAQAPVRDWMRLHLSVEYVNMITEPGPPRILTHGPAEIVKAIQDKVRFLIEAHAARTVAVVGHHDCRANPVSREEHLEQIRTGVGVVQSWGLGIEVIGLWVNEHGYVDEVT